MAERNADLVSTQLYLAALRLDGRRCVVIGGGTIALEKVEGLLACDATVTVIAPELEPPLRALATEGSIAWNATRYGRGDLTGAFLVIAATDDTEVNTAVFAEAEGSNTFCNVVDVPELCSFVLPAIARHGPIAIAISTAGASPALAKRMRDEIGAAYGEPYARLALLLNEVRAWARATLPTYQDRKAFFESIVHGEPDPVALLRDGDEAGVRALIERARDTVAP